MIGQSVYFRVISGQAGSWTAPLRGILAVSERIYARATAARNARYDRVGSLVNLPIPVISVGNLTVGGTGKTPFVMEVVRRLEKTGRRPAVVSRGYLAADGEVSDEQQLIRRRCPAVACLSDPNRSRAAEAARRELAADVIVLDDGFQHRSLGRSLDIVLIDAMNPFGFGHLLPRGLLREPVASLRRADVVAITRCDQVSPGAVAQVEEQVHGVAPQAMVIKCIHHVIGIETLDRVPLAEPLFGKRAVLFAGIGCPAAFAATIRAMGIQVVGERWYADHYRYRHRDIESLLRDGRLPAHDILITTEKDAVKLEALAPANGARIAVVKVAIDFLGGGGTMLQSRLESALQRT